MREHKKSGDKPYGNAYVIDQRAFDALPDNDSHLQFKKVCKDTKSKILRKITFFLPNLSALSVTKNNRIM